LRNTKRTLAKELKCQHTAHPSRLMEFLLVASQTLTKQLLSAVPKLDTDPTLTKTYNSSILLRHFYTLTCIF